MSVQDSIDMTSMEDNHSNHDHGSQSGHDDIQMTNKKATGQGVINSVDKANRKVNINHEAILDIGWPAMTMDLDVSEDVNLDSLSSNQQIQFHMELGKDKIYRITKIMNANEKIDNDNHDHGGHTH